MTHPASVERSRASGSVSQSPHRQFERTPTPVGSVLDQPMDVVAQVVADRIRSARYGRRSGSFVIGLPDGSVYVLTEIAIATKAFLTRHSAHMVGFYAGEPSKGGAARCPKASQLLGDLAQHFHDIGLIPAESVAGAA